MIERQQNIKTSAKRKMASNWTLSGNLIEGGTHITGNAIVCGSCGDEMAPYSATDSGICINCF